MDKNIRLTSQGWYTEFYKDKCTIMDKDGWSRMVNEFDYSWFEELITHEEFTKRLCSSTVIWNTEKL